MARTVQFAVLLLSAVACGCSSSQDPTSQSSGQELATPAIDESPSLDVVLPKPVQAAPALTPDQVVEAFLRAVREGDKQTTSDLLTDKARDETAKHDLVVQPPGTPSAKFVIGGVQYIDERKSGAHVSTVWTESDSTGAAVTYDVVWALRRQAKGWRVAGIATEIVEGEPPVFLNFEDPADMLRKWQRAEEIATRHQQPGSQAAPNSSVIRR